MTDTPNAITALILERWNEYCNWIDDDERIAQYGVAVFDNQRAAIDAWLDDELEHAGVLYTFRGTQYRSLETQLAEIALQDLDYDRIAAAIIDAARDSMSRIEDAVMYLIDGHWGQYMYQALCECYADNLYADEDDIRIVAEDLDCEYYHDVVTDVLHAGMFVDGIDYVLYSGDGIWAVREDLAVLLPDDWPM